MRAVLILCILVVCALGEDVKRREVDREEEPENDQELFNPETEDLEEDFDESPEMNEYEINKRAGELDNLYEGDIIMEPEELEALKREFYENHNE